jgi:hypothetical protein
LKVFSPRIPQVKVNRVRKVYPVVTVWMASMAAMVKKVLLVAKVQPVRVVLQVRKVNAARKAYKVQLALKVYPDNAAMMVLYKSGFRRMTHPKFPDRLCNPARFG